MLVLKVLEEGSSHLGFGKSSMDGEKVNENKNQNVISEITNKYNNLLSEAKNPNRSEEFKS
jgi:hypothetical protein